ncbi:MAG: SUMF1/EgtB/PvdO family nonheme iron enzyme, partial [Polyangiales bacterium]
MRLLWSGFAAACASQPPPPEAATAAALPLPAPPAAQAPSAPKGAPPTDAPAEPQKNTDGAWRCPDKAAWPAGMACVEGGRFVRGDAAEGQPDERGSGEVFVDTFFMDTHEVNNAAYQHCIDAGQCKKPRPFRGFGAAQQPVVAVSWYDAVAHCQMLGKRLPTESEWERAARGPKNTRYPWGDEARGCEALTMEVKGRGPGKGKGCGQNLTRPVGSYAPGHWGLYDMAGNVHEWVLDWYSPCYAGCKKECGQDCMGPNPRGPCEGAESCPKRELRSVRGGSWYWPLERARGAARRGSEPRNRQPHRFGFRCAQNFEPAGAAGATADAGRARPRPTGVATQPTATRPKPAGSAQPAKAHHSGAAALHDAARPLPAQLSAALSAVAHEQTPATTRFYYKSNEWRHDLLRRDLQGRGGALIAVAADPSYTLAAMAGSSLIAIIDFDRR